VCGVREHQCPRTASGGCAHQSAEHPGRTVPCILSDHRADVSYRGSGCTESAGAGRAGFDASKLPTECGTPRPRRRSWVFTTTRSRSTARWSRSGDADLLRIGYYNSAIEVPEPDAGLLQPEGRARGTVRSAGTSPKSRDLAPCYILHAARLRHQHQTKYPVLYLLHGLGRERAGLARQGTST
jgi:hypothetical protein